MAFLRPIQLVFSFLVSANLFASAKLQAQARTHVSQRILLLARYFQHNAEKALNIVQSWHQTEPGRSLMKPIEKQRVNQNPELGILEIQCKTLAQMVDMLNSTTNITALSVSLCTRVYFHTRMITHNALVYVNTYTDTLPVYTGTL